MTDGSRLRYVLRDTCHAVHECDTGIGTLFLKRTLVRSSLEAPSLIQISFVVFLTKRPALIRGYF